MSFSCSTVFPNEPVITVKGNIIEVSNRNSFLLTYFNHESPIATKASRLKEVAKDKMILILVLAVLMGLMQL